MKTPVVRLIIIITISLLSPNAKGQMVETNFIHLKNVDLREAIEGSMGRFERSLKRLNIEADTISINYDMHRNCVYLMHTVVDPIKISQIYMSFLVHCAFVKEICPNARIEFAKILVQHLDNEFLVSEYGDLVYMTGTRKARWYTANYEKHKYIKSMLAQK